MITISILLIVTGATIPSFNQLKLKIESEAVMHEWMQFLNSARASAIANESVITVCPLVKNSCDSNLTNTWSMFTDNNKNKQLDKNEQLIRVLTPTEKLSLKIYPSNRNFLRFYNEPSGIYSGLMSSLTLCPTGKADSYASHLRINIMGRVSGLQTRDTKGVPLRDNNGTLERITCS